MLNPILETAIGLFFVYLLLSMICSAVQEWIAALFALRAKTLRQGLSNMLGHDQSLVAQIYDHPLIKGLSRKSLLDKVSRREPAPSYISSEVFAQAFLSSAGVDPGKPVVPPRAANGQPLSSDTQKMLATFLSTSDSPETLRSNVEDWYNDAMARVSGWYKRQTQTIILCLGLAIAILANADTIMLVRVFWHDPAIRAAAVAAAADWVNSHQRPAQAGPTQTPAQARQKMLADLYPSVSDDKPEPVPPPEAQFRAASENLADTFTQVSAQLDRIRLPLGWCPASAQPACGPGQSLPASGREWLLKIGGLLVTMIALSQGAPFWFDLLQKLVNLRLAGSSPAESKKK